MVGTIKCAQIVATRFGMLHALSVGKCSNHSDKSIVPIDSIVNSIPTFKNFQCSTNNPSFLAALWSIGTLALPRLYKNIAWWSAASVNKLVPASYNGKSAINDFIPTPGLRAMVRIEKLFDICGSSQTYRCCLRMDVENNFCTTAQVCSDYNPLTLISGVFSAWWLHQCVLTGRLREMKKVARLVSEVA